MNPRNDLKMIHLLNTLANISSYFMNSARVYSCEFRIKSIHICKMVTKDI